MPSGTTEPPGIWDRVFALAERGRYSTSPNPRVGCVLVRDGAVVGEGFHAVAGGPHAEVAALAAAGASARGATAYVNLEPCASRGRTGPCAEALAAAGIRSVVASILDPDPRTAGRGVTRLREAGIAVQTGPEAGRAFRLNEPFLVSVSQGRPYVHLKWAATLDGKIAAEGGRGQRITGEAAVQEALRLREEHDAILVGAGTVRADDPRLTRRLGLNASLLPHRRIVLAGRELCDPSARAFVRPEGAAAESWLVTARAPDDLALAPFRRAGVRVVSIPDPGSGARVDLPGLLALLERAEVRSLLVEGGGETAWSFVRAGLVDRVTVFVAPRILGGAHAPTGVGGAGYGAPAEALGLVDVEAVPIDDGGGDLRVTGRVAGRGAAP